MTLFSTTIQFNTLCLFLYLGSLSGIVFNFLFLISNSICKKLKQCSVLKTKKIKSFFYKTFKTIFSFLLNSFNLLTFASTIVISYLINLNLNFGQISVALILIWGTSFYLGTILIKIVANNLINFYNIHIKRKLKSEQQKQ